MELSLFLTVKGGHEQFETYLKCSEFKNNKFFVQMIHALVGEWETLKVLTVKMHREYFAEKLSREKAENYKNIFVEKLGKIADLEQEALTQFQSTFKTAGSAECNSVVQEDVNEEETSWYLDLTYNEHTHMVDSEDFYVDGEIQYGKIWRTQVSEFTLPPVEEHSFNCMFCDGQQLALGRHTGKIALLLYAAYGAQFEQIEVDYEDRKEFIDLSVSDWTEEPLHHEEIAWQADFKSKLPGNYDYTGKIAAVELQVDSRKVCQQITLPKCKELHIFAITVTGKGY